jgi:hypothetical protein
MIEGPTISKLYVRLAWASVTAEANGADTDETLAAADGVFPPAVVALAESEIKPAAELVVTVPGELRLEEPPALSVTTSLNVAGGNAGPAACTGLAQITKANPARRRVVLASITSPMPGAFRVEAVINPIH